MLDHAAWLPAIVLCINAYEMMTYEMGAAACAPERARNHA